MNPDEELERYRRFLDAQEVEDVFRANLDPMPLPNTSVRLWTTHKDGFVHIEIAGPKHEMVVICAVIDNLGFIMDDALEIGGEEQDL